MGTLSVAIPQKSYSGQGYWHKVLGHHQVLGCCWSGKCSNSSGSCPRLHRDPPRQVESFPLHGQPHAWHGVPITLGSCVSSAPGGSQSPFQKLPAALPHGDSFVPTSLLAGSNVETLINHFTSG